MRPGEVSASFSREGAHYSPSKAEFWRVLDSLAAQGSAPLTPVGKVGHVRAYIVDSAGNVRVPTLALRTSHCGGQR